MLRSFFLGLSFLICQSLFAQDNEFGVRISHNFTDFSNESSLTGNSFSAYYKFDLSDKFKLEPSLQYRTQTFLYDLEVLEQDVDVDYFSIPIALHYTPFKSKPWNTLYVMFGAQADLVIGAEMTHSTTGEREDVHSDFNYVNGGIYYGAGYTINRKIDLQFRWYKGLGENFIEPEVTGALEKNNFFELSIGFIILAE